MAAFDLMKIKALRMFSHYHLGTISQGEVKEVKKETGEMLVKMGLAEEPEQPKNGGNRGNKRRADGDGTGSSEG